MNESQWRPVFCWYPRRIEGKLVWLRIVWRYDWWFGCIAGSWEGSRWRLTAPLPTHPQQEKP